MASNLSESSKPLLDPETNPYLELRREKIARNEARLRELGLLKTHAKPALSAEADSKFQPEKGSNGPMTVALRRSSRKRTHVQSLAEDIVSDKEFLHDSQTSVDRATKRLASSSAAIIDDHKQSSFSSFSARAMHMNFAKLILGDTSGCLGRYMKNAGKAHVMEESARLGVEGYTGHNISFNKYSGVQEWGNDVLFLWVNLDAPDCDVVNEFRNGGCHVTWFGGSRMHNGTPVIRKLVRVGQDPNLEKSSDKGIILWCRKYNPETKGFSAYACLGRLAVSSAVVGAPWCFCCQY